MTRAVKIITPESPLQSADLLLCGQVDEKRASRHLSRRSRRMKARWRVAGLEPDATLISPLAYSKPGAELFVNMKSRG